MKILNRLLIILLTSFLFLMSVGAEEPINSDEQQTTILNAEDAEEETNKILENDTNAIVEENNNKTLEDVENSETTDEGENTTVEAPIQATNPSTEEEITSNSNNGELTEDQQQSELGKLTYELIYNEDKTYATLIVTYNGKCEELTIANQQTLDPLVEKGIYVVNTEKGDWINSIAFDIYSNGVVPLDINIWGESYDEPLGTLRLEVVISELKEKAVEKVVEVPAKYDITANVEGSSSQSSMTVTYTHVNSYNWTIPTGFDLNNGSKLTISVTNPEISEEAALKIKVNSLNNYKLVGANPDNTSTMSYTITNENGVALNNTNNVALQYNMDTDTGTKSSNLTFNYNKNDALYTDTYSDQLNFTAQIGLGSGTKINIGDKKYTILEQVGDNQYLVMERDVIGNIQYNPNVDENGNYKIGTYEIPGARLDGNNASLYEDSYIDKYLNNTYFNTLSTEIQNAIVDTTIKQNFYSFSGIGNNWSYGTKTDAEGEWTGWWYNEGISESPSWVRYPNHTPVAGNEGAYPLRCSTLQSKGHNGVESNKISRKIFLPSVEELSKVVNLSDELEVYNFLKNTNGSLSHMWLRDSRSENATDALYLCYGFRSLNNYHVTFTSIGVRPAYVLDLSRVTYNMEGKVNFAINGITYKAKEGSTWEEWVSSKYNALGYTIDSNGNISKNNMYITNTNDINDKVSKTDVIVANTDYYASEFILPAGTKLTIGSKKYTVIEQKGSDRYLLMERDVIRNIQWNLSEDDGNVYENSYVDTYLNSTYFNTLSAEIQNAIVATTIKQNFYSHSGSNPLYSGWGYKPGTSSGENTCWYNEGTAENPNWVQYYNHIPQDGEEGLLPLRTWTKQDKGYNGTVANEIARKIFLPSVEEVSKVVDLNSQKEVMEFVKNTNGTNSHLWLRDSRSQNATNAIHLSCDYRSLDRDIVTLTSIGVRPAYTLDLSQLDYIIE